MSETDRQAFLAILGYVFIVVSITPQVLRNFLTRDATNFTVLFPSILVLGLAMLLPSVFKSRRRDLVLGTVANIVSAMLLLVSVVLFGGKLGI